MTRTATRVVWAVFLVVWLTLAAISGAAFAVAALAQR